MLSLSGAHEDMNNALGANPDHVREPESSAWVLTLASFAP
jgi:hypothetical protein